jgi:nucleoside-diphosphate-sugar epimerase
MIRTHLITGGTGFIGGALALELLARTDDELVCLTRSNAKHSAAERLAEALRTAAVAYKLEHLLPAAAERCIAVDADLTLPGCGVDVSGFGTIDHIWHCAASLQYKDMHRKAIWAANVDGTANLLELAEQLGGPPLVYVSTAYVAGNRAGDIPEGPEAGSDHVNNWYERSKVAAEALVQNSGLSDWRIARPSIVIGHSQTLQATSFTGMYGFLRELVGFERRVSDKLESHLRFRPVRFIGEPDCFLNFIPVDAVARSLAQIGLAPLTDDRYFHLTNLTPTTVRDAISLFFKVAGCGTPDFVMSAEYLSSIDERIDKEMGFYRSYFRNSKSFQADATVRYVGRQELEWDVRPEALQPYVQWYVERLKASPRPTERGGDAAPLSPAVA